MNLEDEQSSSNAPQAPQKRYAAHLKPTCLPFLAVSTAKTSAKKL